MNMKKELGILVAIMCLMGCAAANVTKISENAYPPKPEDCEMKVLTQPPTDQKYEELGIVSGVTGQAWWQGKDLDSMLPGMKAEACKLGADALVLKNVEAGGVAWIQSTQGKASAVAIKYAPAKK
jgi:hypothetical protein